MGVGLTPQVRDLSPLGAQNLTIARDMRKDVCEIRDEGFGQPSVTGRVRVQAIGLHQPGIYPNLAHETGHECYSFFIGYSDIHFCKRRCVGRSVICWNVHTQEEDACSSLSAAPDDLPEIRFGVLERLAAPGGVTTELDDQHIDLLTQDPVEACEATGRGVAADTSVDGIDDNARFAEELFGHGGKGVGLGQPLPRAEAVA